MYRIILNQNLGSIPILLSCKFYIIILLTLLSVYIIIIYSINKKGLIPMGYFFLQSPVELWLIVR